MTALVRTVLRDAIKAARDAHPGLLLQRGWVDFTKADTANGGHGGRGEHIERICKIPASALYEHAYERWLKVIADDRRFARVPMKIEGRLLIGITGGGALETGCAVSHSYGMPYLPGSSIKGVVRAWAETNMQEWQSQFNNLFGPRDSSESGMVGFHDAWWIPGSGGANHKNLPFVTDIVTPHHPDYYAGKAPATDLDSPVPNNLIGVRGSFLFVIEGHPMWLKLAQRMLESAMSDRGIGAKTRAGYGYLSVDKVEAEKTEKAAKQKRESETYIRVKLHRNVGTGEIKAILQDGKTTAPLKGAAADALLNKLPEELRKGKKIKEGKLDVEATIVSDGNMLVLVDIRIFEN